MKGLVNITNVVDHETESERLCIVIVAEVLLDLVNVDAVLDSLAFEELS